MMTVYPKPGIIFHKLNMITPSADIEEIVEIDDLFGEQHAAVSGKRSIRFVSPDPVNGDPEDPLSWNRYLYCRNDPVNLIDPTGEVWLYTQENGELAHLDDTTGQVDRNIAVGYSGKNKTKIVNGKQIKGLNNQDAEMIPFFGPIPAGDWEVTDMVPTKYGKLPNGHRAPTDYTLVLSPKSGTNTFGRDNFLIHGDKPGGNQEASEGCIVLNKNMRIKIWTQQFNGSTDHNLKVFHDKKELETFLKNQSNQQGGIPQKVVSGQNRQGP